MPPAHLGETSVFRLGGRGGEEVVRAYQLFGSLIVLNKVWVKSRGGLQSFRSFKEWVKYFEDLFLTEDFSNPSSES